METKTCKTCKLITELVKNRLVCRECARIERIAINKKYNESEKGQIISKNWREANKEKSKAYNQNWYQDHRELTIQRAAENKAQNLEHYREVHNANERERRKTDPIFRMKGLLRSAVRRALKGNKNGESTKQYLPYTFEQLQCYLESQFEQWMTWENHGIYNPKTWNENDQTTWTWQIDHIVPQSELPYTSMEDDNFKKCWALENLRPYSAKQNILDGVNRVRHQGKK